MPRALWLILAGAAASLLLVRAAPGYDPWTWLLWGREVAGGGLSTVDGPAFKPLPVAVCALLSVTGSAAPWLWVGLVRVAAGVAIWLAFRLARRLAGGSAVAGALAAVAVALTTGFASQAATGGEAPLVIALALAGGEAWRVGRTRTALLCGAGCALLRVEAWPFLALAALVAWRRDPGVRPLVAGLAVVVPAAWFVPEWIGSGDPLRSGSRARIPMEGQPALADVPALASLQAALEIAVWPLLIGLAGLRGTAQVRVAVAGAAWIALVAVMAQAGFSGEPRYLLPGVALLCVAAAAGWSRIPVRSVLVAAVLVVATLRVVDLNGVRSAQAHQWALQRDLTAAVDAAGGRDGVLACGTPYVGPLRGPLMAYRLRVTTRTV